MIILDKLSCIDDHHRIRYSDLILWVFDLKCIILILLKLMSYMNESQKIDKIGL